MRHLFCKYFIIDKFPFKLTFYNCILFVSNIPKNLSFLEKKQLNICIKFFSMDFNDFQCKNMNSPPIAHTLIANSSKLGVFYMKPFHHSTRNFVRTILSHINWSIDHIILIEIYYDCSPEESFNSMLLHAEWFVI